MLRGQEAGCPAPRLLRSVLSLVPSLDLGTTTTAAAPRLTMLPFRVLRAGLLAAAFATAAAEPWARRRVQYAETLACEADLSGTTRGVPDGRVDVMDVRIPELLRFPAGAS